MRTAVADLRKNGLRLCANWCKAAPVRVARLPHRSSPPGTTQAIERSRLQNATAQQQILWTEGSSQSVDPITPAHVEQGVPTTEGGQAAASTATSLEDGKLKASSSPSDCCLQATPSKPDDTALADLLEKKLSSSIEQIEKMVKQNLKKTPKAARPSKRAIQRHILMSMR